MAMHRRTVRVATPAELLMFSEGDCVAPDDEASWVAFPALAGCAAALWKGAS